MDLHEYLKNVLDSGERSDFSIFVYDETGNKVEKKVHQFIIRRCPYFSAMLDLNGQETNNARVTFENITSNTLNIVLRYIYTETLPEITAEQAVNTASAADYLQLAKLKAAALERWKEIFINMKDHSEMARAFEKLAESSLQITLDASWRTILEVMIALWLYQGWDMTKISPEFIRFFVSAYGRTHPYFTAESLIDWTLAKGALELSDEELAERKVIAADLVQQIDLLSLRLRSIVEISKKNVFPANYMLQILQKRSERPDQSVECEVTYELSFKSNRIVELEYDADYALFWLKAHPSSPVVHDTPIQPGVIQLWEMISAPLHSVQSVQIYVRDYQLTESVNNKRAFLFPRAKGTPYLVDGRVRVRVIFGPSAREENPKYWQKFNYTIDFE